jgi:hypothetical protein
MEAHCALCLCQLWILKILQAMAHFPSDSFSDDSLEVSQLANDGVRGVLAGGRK